LGQTPQAQQYASEEFGQMGGENKTVMAPPPLTQSTQSPQSSGGMDPVSMLSSLFGGGGGTGSKVLGALI
jgi:hypothetical protein